MALFLAWQRGAVSRPGESLHKSCTREDPLYALLAIPEGYCGSVADLLLLADAITRFRNETLRVYGVLEIRLSGKYTGEPREYLAGKGKGKYSVADIGTWPWVKGWEMSGFTEEDMKPFPHLKEWIARIAARPAVQRGIGDAYAIKQ